MKQTVCTPCHTELAERLNLRQIAWRAECGTFTDDTKMKTQQKKYYKSDKHRQSDMNTFSHIFFGYFIRNGKLTRVKCEGKGNIIVVYTKIVSI